jgi:hypothetical protein
MHLSLCSLKIEALREKLEEAEQRAIQAEQRAAEAEQRLSRADQQDTRAAHGGKVSTLPNTALHSTIPVTDKHQPQGNDRPAGYFSLYSEPQRVWAPQASGKHHLSPRDVDLVPKLSPTP